MTPALVALFLVVLAASLFIALLRSLVRIWLDHRTKLAILEQLEKTTLTSASASQLQTFLKEILSVSSSPARQDFTATGAFLAAIGTLALLTGKALRVGQFAVGLYLGGIVCVALGLLLAVSGLLIRTMTTLPRTREPKE